MSATEHFRNAMRRAGLDYDGEIVADGKLHRFKADGWRFWLLEAADQRDLV